MAFSNPEIVRFANETMRPLAERLRDLDMMIGEAAVEYTTIVQPILSGISPGTEVLDDGRAGEGVTQVTKDEIASLITHLNAVRLELNGAGNDALRAKFTVRAANIS